MKVVLIGTGGIAHLHAASLRKLGIGIGGVLGVDRKEAEDFRKQYGIDKAYTSLDEFDGSLDGVHIATPPNSHFDYAMFCLENDIPLICEKPLSIDLEEAKTLSAKAEGKKVALNFNNRYLDLVNEYKDRVYGEDIKAIMGHYYQSYHILPVPYSWRYDVNVGGKMRAVTEIGSHYFDLVRYITGEEIVEVFASFLNTKEDVYLSEQGELVRELNDNKVSVKNEDIAYVTFKLSGGGLCNVSLSEISHGRNNEILIDINTGGRNFIVNLEQPYKLYEGVGGSIIEHSFPFGGGFSNTFESFFEDFYFKRHGGKYANFLDGYENAKILEAIYRSSLSGSFELVN